MTQAPIDHSAIHPIQLRRLRLESNLVLAPLAGVSNFPFRLISREAGAALYGAGGARLFGASIDSSFRELGPDGDAGRRGWRW